MCKETIDEPTIRRAEEISASGWAIWQKSVGVAANLRVVATLLAVAAAGWCGLLKLRISLFSTGII